MLRKILFWSHLSAGVLAGLVILMMSVTGVILTYERQILAWADRSYHFEPAAGQERLALDALLVAAGDELDFEPGSVTLSADPTAPAVLRAGRANSARVNPYTGAVYAEQNQGLHNFFGVVTRLHRWFNLSGDSRDSARAVTGASNLLFLFIVLSGLYLWLPRVYRWGAFRLRLWFGKAPNSAARDFNWHHVFGIWAALPLLVIIATATVFYYGWANNLVYRLAGEEPPRRGGPPGQSAAAASEAASSSVAQLPLEELFARASQVQDWNTLTMNLPAAGAREVSFSVDQGNGGQPQKRHSFSLDAQSGELVSETPFSSLSAGRQARSWVRFLHTGEALGIVGQTVAGLASLAAVFMVWTGLALALRRLLRFREKKARQNLAGSTAS